MTTYAAFDLDGTLTERDTFLPFLRTACGRRRTALALGASWLPLAQAAVRGGERRDVAKAAVIGRLLAGEELARLTPLAEAFADDVVAGWLRPKIAGLVGWHRSEGHQLVIVSASPELYVEPIGRRLGIDTVLATRLEVAGNGRLTGRLLGRNCRGAEKVARLRQWLGETPLAFAYGDSQGDAEMLALAAEGTYVGKKRG